MAVSTGVAIPVLAIIAGVLILLVPKILNSIVAFHVIIVGALGLVAMWRR